MVWPDGKAWLTVRLVPEAAVHQVVAGSKEGPSTPLVIHVDPAWHPRNGKVFLKAA